MSGKKAGFGKASRGVNMAQQTLDKIQGIDFDVFTSDSKDEYRSTKEKGYQWATGPDGSLFIYEKVMHKTFHVAVKDARIKVYNNHYWSFVEVLDLAPEEEVESLTDEAVEKTLIEVA